MRERPSDQERLQALLDRSYRDAGAHLASVHTPERRMSAADIAARLQGVRVFAVATTTADGRPIARPLDGLLYRGDLWVGSSPDSLLVRHLRARPEVSAVHTEGEHLAVTVHGTAGLMSPAERATMGFDDLCREVYGPEWSEWGAPAAYARVEARRMYAFSMEGGGG